MKGLIAILCITVLSACTTPPRTAGELRDGKGNSIGLSKKETHDINKKFSSVVKNLKRKSEECLRFSYSTTSNYLGTVRSHGTTLYNENVKVVSKGKAEMTVQKDRMPRADHDPEGGYYVFLTDIKATSANKVRLTMYGPSFSTWQPIFNAVKGWAEGKNIKCPETP